MDSKKISRPHPLQSCPQKPKHNYFCSRNKTKKWYSSKLSWISSQNWLFCFASQLLWSITGGEFCHEIHVKMKWTLCLYLDSFPTAIVSERHSKVRPFTILSTFSLFNFHLPFSIHLRSFNKPTYYYSQFLSSQHLQPCDYSRIRSLLFLLIYVENS